MDEKNRKQQLIIKICCLIAAFGLWLYITSVLNPIKTYKKNIPVTIINEDNLENFKLSLLPDQKPYVSLTLRGSINDIYSISEDQFKVVVDLSAYVLKRGENNIPVQIQQSPDKVNIINNDNLWVKVMLDDLIEKTVPFKINVVGKVKDGYFPLEATSSINEVTIKGAAQFVNYVQKAEVKCDITNAYRDLATILPIHAVDKDGDIIENVKIKPISAEVKVPIQKVKSVTINVKTTGQLSENRILQGVAASPEKVEITGEETLVKTIESLDTEPINLAEVTGEEAVAKLVLPKGVELVKKDEVVKIKVYFNTVADKAVSLLIKTMNLPGDHTIQLDRDRVSIVISGLYDIVNNIKDEDIECFVDLQSLKEGTHNLPVKVNLPEGVNLVSISPDNINVTIKLIPKEEPTVETKPETGGQNAS